MVRQTENEKLTRVEGDAPMGRLMRENCWLPFALSVHLVPGDAPIPVRLLGENFIAFRAEDGRIGFFDELCPHRRASLALGRIEGNGVRCIYHGWKIDVSGCVAEAPTQVVRPEQFASNVRVAHFPVHEAGGLAWVWLGETDAPAFPELPFAGYDTDHSWMTMSQVPCNWLQGLEGTIDSVHVGFLHQTWHKETAKLPDRSNLAIALKYHPSYETQSTTYGMRAAALRPTADGCTYVRVTEYLMPLVAVVPIGSTEPGNGAVFAISPVDDTHHLVFFGAFSEAPLPRPEEMPGFVAPGWTPDPYNFAGLNNDRATLWGQDRELMKAGHFTGFGRNLLEEDAAIQTSMGPILDRTKEHLSSGDVAVAHARRMLLDALSAAEKGERPPGSALAAQPINLPNALEGLLHEGERWQDMTVHHLETATPN
jgi:phenylpropionate dioxygenase-like ring-hydroxylating dioxygenase large terminal subunit